MAIDDRRRSDRRTLQVSTWRDDQGVAVISPSPTRPGTRFGPEPAVVAAELARLQRQGVRRVLTGALQPGELAPFAANGFQEHEHLHLLRHDLRRLPTAPPGIHSRRARRRDRNRVLAIDARAFDAFWTLDRRGLDDAIRATPSSRFRVSDGHRRVVTGYAVTGRAADRGYLQRLAIAPEHQRTGIGRALVTDALRWLRRGGARVAIVNTQAHNTGALALYRACSFVDEPEGLTVLALDLDVGSPQPGRRGPGPRDPGRRGPGGP
jgi:ribosomal protein S18 acetylase RimI-like enzyme